MIPSKSEGQPSHIRSVAWLVAPLILGGAMGWLAANGFMRVLYGWSVTPGWYLTVLVSLVCLAALMLHESWYRILALASLFFAALLCDFIFPAFSRLYVIRALLGICASMGAFSTALSLRKTGDIGPAVIGILSAYIQSVYFFNLFSAREVMRFFGGGEVA